MRLMPTAPRSKTGPILALVVAALTAGAAAVASAADEPPRPVKITGDLGFVSTNGNSDVQTLTGTEKLEYTSGRWLFTQDAAAVWGQDHGVENAGRYLAGLRADYAITKRVSAYGLGLWRRNTFAGIKRQFDEGVGLVYHALVPSPSQLDLEAGAGLSQRENVLSIDESFGTGRFAGLYRYYFKEKTYFEAGATYLANFKDSDDYEYDTKASLVAPLSGLLSMKLGYNYHYRNRPLPLYKKWDSTFAAGIQVTY